MFKDPMPPIVIAHRGASGYRPEHTLAAYELAIQMGADFIEADLVSTRDGVLVARHENEISGTTDVALHPEFADRRTEKVVDTMALEGWFTEDFTLAELKTLRARERMPQIRPDNAAYDGQFEIPTLQEIMDLARRGNVGIYPETKHPSYFQRIGLPLEGPLLWALETNGYNHPNARVFIQSFESGNLMDLRQQTAVKLIRLSAVPLDPREVATYADGIGVEKNLVIPRDAANHLTAPTTLVEEAHAAKLLVHVWTFRNEAGFLPADCDGDTELRRFLDTGIDGVFTDQPDVAVKVVRG